MEEKSRFNFKVDKVLQILCSEIYDSPLSMLRENVQNSFDAILMRKKYDKSMNDAFIRVEIRDKKIIVEDNGIGMNLDNLKQNYWTAGSSGKNNSYARAAGVVGTFGIGAMANFGVCKKLTVITRHYKENNTYTSFVEKKDISTNEDCITTTNQGEQLDHPGTVVIADLDSDFNISEKDAKEYLYPFVKYLNVNLTINGEMISRHSYFLPAMVSSEEEMRGSSKNSFGISFDYRILLNKQSFINPRIEMTSLCQPNLGVNYGNISLNIADNSLFGLRNSFGLAEIPVYSVFNYGGVADLINLIPTAGRDSLSRESISFVASFVEIADSLTAEAIANSDMADSSRELMMYIKKSGKYELAKNIEIGSANSDERFKLGDVAAFINGKRVWFYKGTDKQILNSYDDKDNIVLIPSSDRNRNQIQTTILRRKGIPEVSDSPKIIKIEESIDLSPDDISILYRIKNVVEDDYLIPDCEVVYAEISHGLAMMAESKDDILHIYLKRSSSELNTLRNIYKNDYSLFEPFVKDFVRTSVYNKISQYIPSSQKEGADALYELLQRKKELYEIDTEDYGSMQSVIKDIREGRADYQDLLRVVNREKKRQTQTLDSKSIGNVSEIIGDNTIHQLQSANIGVSDELTPMPPIMRLDTSTDYKILMAEQDTKLEGYGSFLALSEKMDHQFRDFFLQPHTSRVIWSMHKIIYVFTHASGNLTLYYEMDLNKKLDINETGGKSIKTATIITRNKIFVPIINELNYYFDIKQRKLKFYVHYDSVKS